MKTVYLSGAIRTDPNYRAKFAAAAAFLTEQGYTVISPAILPTQEETGWTHEAYMRTALRMMVSCKEVCLLPDWRKSDGARAECADAVCVGIPAWEFEERYGRLKYEH